MRAVELSPMSTEIPEGAEAFILSRLATVMGETGVASRSDLADAIDAWSGQSGHECADDCEDPDCTR